MKAIITVLGTDQPGIIARISACLYRNNVNILDISQTVMQDYFTMIMMVDTELCTLAFAELSRLLREEGESRGLTVRIQREDIFEAMHRI